MPAQEQNAAQEYLSLDQTNYQRWLELLVAEVKNGKPDLAPETENELRAYFEKALERGVRFSGDQNVSFEQTGWGI